MLNEYEWRRLEAIISRAVSNALTSYKEELKALKDLERLDEEPPKKYLKKDRRLD